MTLRPSLRRLAQCLSLSAALLMIAACARIGLGGPSYPALAGEYTGAVVVQGQSVPGTLEVLQAGSELTVDFRAPDFGLVAGGEGTVDSEGRVAIHLDYDLQCDGTAELEGVAARDGRSIEGTLAASDCTGTVQGTFSFQR